MSPHPHTIGNATSTTGSAKVHSPHVDHVHVQSEVRTATQLSVGMENVKKINELMARLGTTHQQTDEYSRKRTEEISEAVNEAIKKVVTDTQNQQHQLLADANKRTTEIDDEFKYKLQNYVAQLDAEKAVLLDQLEKDLNFRQDEILESARRRIDDLNEESNRLKMGVLREAQAQSSAQVSKITEQVVTLGHEDASRRLVSTTTTVITTKAEKASNNEVSGSAINAVAITPTIVQSARHSNGSISSHSEMDKHHH